MKKYATLLIQHLESIYTMMKGKNAEIHHGFLALYHDEIIALGEGDGHVYIDKDTRIIEGRGHIAIPAFCDVSLELPIHDFHTGKAYSYEQMRIHSLYENTTTLMRHGTLIGNQLHPLTEIQQRCLSQFEASYLFDFISQTTMHTPIFTPFQPQNIDVKQPFCISCGYDKSNCLDQLLCAKLIYQAYEVDAQQVLAACTLYPTQALGLTQYGSLEVGKIANILLLQGQDIAFVLTRFHGDEHMQVIKEGTRIFPNILI